MLSSTGVIRVVDSTTHSPLISHEVLLELLMNMVVTQLTMSQETESLRFGRAPHFPAGGSTKSDLH